MNHTPGSWRQFTSPENSWIGNAETGEIVADRPNISIQDIHARWGRNAHLIASAPELLAALKLLREVQGVVTLSDGLATLPDGTEIRLNDIIAQAEGKG